MDDSSVARLLALLHTEGAALDLDAQAEFAFRDRLRGAGAVPRVRLRMSASRDFAELRIERTTRASPTVFAAGPVEDFLAALGFEPLNRAVSTELSLEIGGSRVHLRHIATTGWRCEIESENEDSLRTAASLLGLGDELPAVSALRRLEIADWNGSERRGVSDRRIARTDRRSAAAT